MSLLTLFIGCAENTFKSSSPPKIQFGTDETLDILTWNIENFPKVNYSTVDRLSELINSLDVDIIAFQEIESQFYFDDLKNKLEGWEGYRANSAAYELNLAFLYKSGLSILEPYEIYENDSYSFPRSPLILEIEWNYERIIIINNHLKATISGYSDLENEENVLRRESGCILLKNYIDNNLEFENVIVLGDYNDLLTDPLNTLNILNKNVFKEIILDSLNFEFIDMNIALNSSSYWSYPTWPSHLDHILITNELFDNVVHVQTIIAEDYLSGGWSEYEDVITQNNYILKF